MNGSPEGLKKSWDAIYHGAGEAIRWIKDVRPDAPSLDGEADGLIRSLRQKRNLARSLGAASALPMTVGFFGLSQAGKSYLISTLAAGKNGKLETCLDGQRLDFITQVNPPGGGKEATGLVTRFSHHTERPGPVGFPLQLKLFSEIDLAKVLTNSYFNDFDPEKREYRFEDDKIRRLLGELERCCQPEPISGVVEEDVVALWDYQEKISSQSKSSLDGYWRKAVELAPRLAVKDRTRLFSIFWGEIKELSDVYLHLAETLARLGHANQVFAPLSVLVKLDNNGGLSRSDNNIMDVDTLERLDKDGDQRIEVCPVIDGEHGAPVDLSPAELAALTAELVFPLSEPPSDDLFGQVDLLDFPGYRGRLKVGSLRDDVRLAMNNKDASPVAPLILRGKVAYLFERYTDNQEMNVLIMCTASDHQSEVADVGPVLGRWIDKTQGNTSEERVKRKSGLLWAITRFDLRIGDCLNRDENTLRQIWGGLMEICMIERFGQYSWLQEWAPKQPFNTTFLVRKPRTRPSTFLDLDSNDNEQAIRDSEQKALALMRQTFCEDDTVRRYVGEPEAAWKAMLKLNDGGMERIAGYLRDVAQGAVKLQRIEEQLKEVRHQLDTRLDRYFQAEGAEEAEKKKRIVGQISKALRSRRTRFGDLLQRMQLPEETLRNLYLHSNDDSPEDAEAAATLSGALNPGDSPDADDDFDPFGDALPATASSAAPPSRESGAHFAQAVLREWKAHLNGIPEDTRLMRFFGFDKKAIEDLVGELKTTADRLKLQDRLSKAITGPEQTGAKREDLVARQVLVANAVLGDFIGWLGFAEKPPEQRPPSRLASGARLFQPAPDGGLSQLPEKPLDYTGYYIMDWLVGLGKLAVDNAGHSAGREITPQQNAALGEILKTLREAQPDQS